MNLSALLVVAAYMHLYFFKQIPCGSVNLRGIVIVDFKLRPFQLSHFLPYFRFTKLADFKWMNLMKLQNEQGNHSSSLFISLSLASLLLLLLITLSSHVFFHNLFKCTNHHQLQNYLMCFMRKNYDFE